MKKDDFIAIMRRTQVPLKGMIEMVPDDKLDWAPAENFMSVSQVLKHLSENWVLVKILVTQEWPFKDPKEMEEALKLENMPRCSKAEALEAMEKDLNDTIAFIENEISEEDFFSKVVTAPWGFEGEIWKAVLMAKEHLINHKMQLHLYLKLLGQPVSTQTLYGS
ncbi:MAG: DinB family protein [Candidatus Aminicenantes bacterium]|nr:MAG: DinB family protein [Candidatus Aminicenantes bacterium]